MNAVFCYERESERVHEQVDFTEKPDRNSKAVKVSNWSEWKNQRVFQL